MLAKNLPWSSLWWKLPFRIGLDAVAAWKELFGGNRGSFTAIAKAHWGFLVWLVAGKKSSQPALPRKKIVDGVYKGSIVWQYFIKKKQSFFEIIGRN